MTSHLTGTLLGFGGAHAVSSDPAAGAVFVCFGLASRGWANLLVLKLLPLLTLGPIRGALPWRWSLFLSVLFQVSTLSVHIGPCYCRCHASCPSHIDCDHLAVFSFM